MWFLYGIYISICIFAVCFVMMTVNKLKIIRFMKELVKRLSVPIAEMGACMVMVCLLPSCSVASLFHEEIGKEEAMVLMADSTRYVGKTFLRVSSNLVGINFQYSLYIPFFASWKTITYKCWHV